MLSMSPFGREASRLKYTIAPYRQIFAVPAYRTFWIGFTVSALGDAMSSVALIWLVLEMTHSPSAVGWLLFCYTGPVIVGGLLAGYFLDRFDRRKVMLIDTIVRGVAMATLPVLFHLGALALWQIYAVGSIYGFFYMITLAGAPSLIPSLIDTESLTAANALETISYTCAGMIGPALAGLLIAKIGAPHVILADALSYGIFALALVRLRHHIKKQPTQSPESIRRSSLIEAVRLVLSNRVLLATTVMFMFFNIGNGALALWLPFFATQLGTGSAQIYGILLGCVAVGEAVGAALGGGVHLPFSLGMRICLAQLCAGCALCLLVFSPTWGSACIALALYGACSAPLTIWAQTLRMRIIPAHLRGRTFALLRTMMQGAGPLASAGTGLLLPITGIPMLIGLSAVFVGAPGIFGAQQEDLRQANAGEALLT